MINKLGNMTVRYSASNDSVGFADTTTSGWLTTTYPDDNTTWVTWPWYHEYYHPWHHYHEYHPHGTWVQSEDKFEKAFAVAKMLLKKKLLASRKLPDFISLVEGIAELL